jgi:UDP-N-acetyl-D-mannosaminuronate dehydrogenase
VIAVIGLGYTGLSVAVRRPTECASTDLTSDAGGIDSLMRNVGRLYEAVRPMGRVKDSTPAIDQRAGLRSWRI